MLAKLTYETTTASIDIIFKSGPIYYPAIGRYVIYIIMKALLNL
jgi:hypothetical protein